MIAFCMRLPNKTVQKLNIAKASMDKKAKKVKYDIFPQF